MRTIQRTHQFKRDYKRESKGRYHSTLNSIFVELVTNLINDRPLADNHRDHAL